MQRMSRFALASAMAVASMAVASGPQHEPAPPAERQPRKRVRASTYTPKQPVTPQDHERLRRAVLKRERKGAKLSALVASGGIA